MLDRFNRRINYLRISVTDRCNMRCVYCMPTEGVQRLAHADILTFNEILEVTKVAVSMGVEKVRITGGEPLVRRGIVELVRMISKVDGIKDLAMTTNAILLDEYAELLSEAGLQRVNISLDTVDALKFKKITRGGVINKVFDGINAAKKAGLFPIKINCVIKNSEEEPDAQRVAEFCNTNGYEIRYIHEMDLETGYFKKVQGGEGGNCGKCNRLRLTANGKIKPCLFSDLEFDVRELGIRNALDAALNNKPLDGKVSFSNKFYNIGG